MKRALSVLAAVAVLAMLSGCSQSHMYSSQGTGLMSGSCPNSPDACRACDPGATATKSRMFDPKCGVPCGPDCGGPTTGAITYPYYTVRGPRDFLAADPRPIGP